MGNIFDCAQNPLALPDEDAAEGDTGMLPAPAGRSWTLQAPTRLLDSAIWDLQRGFYDRMSISAWSDAVVPNFVTSNRCGGRGGGVADGKHRAACAACSAALPAGTVSPLIAQCFRAREGVAWGWALARCPPACHMRPTDRGQASTAWPVTTRPDCLPNPTPPHAPHSFIARAYAKVILGMVKDVFEARAGSPVQGDASQPVYIVEVGAGHGRFAFLVLQALLDLQAFLPKVAR
jgi:hypothetical protein